MHAATPRIGNQGTICIFSEHEVGQLKIVVIFTLSIFFKKCEYNEKLSVSCNFNKLTRD